MKIFKLFNNSSIFFKIMFISIITATVVILLVSFHFYREFSTRDKFIEVLFLESANYIMEDLGESPRLEKAKEIGKRFKYNIGFENKDLKWSTSKKFVFTKEIAVNNAEWFQANSEKNIAVYVNKIEDRLYVLFKRKNGNYIISPDHEFDDMESLIKFSVLILIISLIFLASYFLLKKVFYPIRILHDNIQKTGEGELESKVKIFSQDELGKLTEEFNQMKLNVKAQITTKEQLLLAVSHELRSPITRMNIATEFLPESKAKKNIQEDLRIMGTMITELLETARMNTGYGRLSLNNIDITELIKNLVQQLKLPPERIRLSLPIDPVNIVIDPNSIGALFKNLLENSLKYSEETRIPVEFILNNNKTEIEIEIRDCGIGIPEEDLPYIFEPFYRVDKSRNSKSGGYGLGLHLCKKIVEAHSGKISIESKLGQGTNTTVIIPHSDKF